MIKVVKTPVLIFLSTTILIIALRYFNLLQVPLYNSMLFAGAICFFNYLAFIYLYIKSAKKNNKSFLIINFGGMSARLFLILFLVFIVIKFLNVDDIGFIFTLLVWYVFFLVHEIIIITRVDKAIKSSKNAQNVDN